MIKTRRHLSVSKYACKSMLHCKLFSWEEFIRLGPGRPPPPSNPPTLQGGKTGSLTSFVKLMPKPGNSGGCVLYFVANLDSSSNVWEVVYETSESFMRLL